MTEQEVMIQLRGITKEYRLGQIGYGTLSRDLQSWWAKARHKPDPNMKLGKGTYTEGDRLHALEDINLKVCKGECVGIIGGNGAGKSTLLKVISRVTSPSAGTMDLYGRVTSMLEVGTGFHGEMTGRENIYLNGAILGMSRREIDGKLEEIIEFSEVRDFIDTPVKRYSTGMNVKLAFAVAAHLDSEIVIMDEVLAVGDVAFQQKCISKMRSAAQDENRTVLYVSHNMMTIRELCDRCIVLSEGRLIYDGVPEEAIQFYTQSVLPSNQYGTWINDIRRRDKNLSSLCRMVQLSVTDEEVNYGDALHIHLSIQSRETIQNACLRMVLSNETGVILGMTYSEQFQLNAGRNHVLLSFPTSPLESGGYYGDLVLFSFDGNVQTRHDFLSKVIGFRVHSSQNYFGSMWRQRNWGSIRLSRMRVEETENGGKD